MSTYARYINARSDPPSSVLNFTLNDATLAINNTVLINATWIPPANPNGLLSNYLMCLFRMQQTSDDNSINQNQCKVIPVSSYVKVIDTF